MLKKLWKDEEGMSTVEYALLLALVAIAAITAWATLGSNKPPGKVVTPGTS